VPLPTTRAGGFRHRSLWRGNRGQRPATYVLSALPPGLPSNALNAATATSGITPLTCDLEFFSGPKRGEFLRWPDSPPPLVLRFPVPVALSLDHRDVDPMEPPLVAVYERCRGQAGNAFAYVYVGTRTD
jgi:hypothetical protein